MMTTADSTHMPKFTSSMPSVSTLKRNPEARSCTPRYGTEKTSATMTTRMRIESERK